MASLRDTTGVTPALNNVLVVSGPSSTWRTQAQLIDIVDTNLPTYAIQKMLRTGTVKFMVRTAAERSALLALVTCGRALHLVQDGTAAGVFTYCTTSGGMPQNDVPAWLPTTVTESWVEDDADEYLFVDVEWSQVTGETPVAL